MGMKRSEVKKFYGLEEATSDVKDRDPRFATSELPYDYMLRTDRVNELMETFTWKLEDEFVKDQRLTDGKELEIGLATWVRDQMFKASTYTVLGKRVLEVYPELIEDFWDFDRAMLPLFFGLPKLVIPEDFKIRDKVLSGMQRWQEVAWEECKGQPLDPDDDVSWEPIYGSRVIRARQRSYMYKGLTMQSKAASDLGMIFGLSSNAIPAAYWMLLHILDPNGDKTLLPRVLAELETARSDDDGINIPVLVSLPLIQSILQETLRLYTDVLVARDIKADLVLPIDEGKRQVQFRKGDLVLLPSWLGQRDEDRWNKHDVFYAERFLKRDPETGEDMFTLAGTAGKFFPFGGGKTICPGRVFAKQQVLAVVAMVLLNYDIQPVKFLDGRGKETDKFPCLSRRLPGSGVIAMEGDMEVRMKRRS